MREEFIIQISEKPDIMLLMIIWQLKNTFNLTNYKL